MNHFRCPHCEQSHSTHSNTLGVECKCECCEESFIVTEFEEPVHLYYKRHIFEFCNQYCDSQGFDKFRVLMIETLRQLDLRRSKPNYPQKWKIISNEFTTGKYEVSNWGDVRNIKTTNHLKPDYGHPYRRVCLFNENKRKHYCVHRLVYLAFKGDIPPDKDVDHDDHDPWNSAEHNLILLDKPKNKRKAHARKKKS